MMLACRRIIQCFCPLILTELLRHLFAHPTLFLFFCTLAYAVLLFDRSSCAVCKRYISLIDKHTSELSLCRKVQALNISLSAKRLRAAVALVCLLVPSCLRVVYNLSNP
jgi:hypothetical protein